MKISTRKEIVLQKVHFQVGMNLNKYRNKAEIKEGKKTTLLQNDGRKERQKM